MTDSVSSVEVEAMRRERHRVGVARVASSTLMAGNYPGSGQFIPDSTIAINR